jgi:hypothetical protein
VVAPGLQLMQRNLEHRRTMAGQGPAAQPTAIAVVIHPDHLENLLSRSLAPPPTRAPPLGGIPSVNRQVVKGVGPETDAGALLEVHSCGGGADEIS